MLRLTRGAGMILLAALAMRAAGATYTWDDETADHEWTTVNNWSGNTAVPARLDDVKFNDTKTGTCHVAANAHVRYLYVTNTAGTVEYDVPPGASLSADVRQGYAAPCQHHVVVRGGGTFSPTGDVAVARKTAIVGYSGRSILTVTNTTFESRYLNNLYVGATPWPSTSSGSLTGILDLAGATVQCNSRPNMLAARGSMTVGFVTAYGLVRLPPALTNLTIGGDLQIGMYSGSTAGTRRAEVDFGADPALRSLVVSNKFTLNHGAFLFREGGQNKTGLPVRAELVIGAPGDPTEFLLGYTYSAGFRVRLGNFRALRAWLSRLWIAHTGNSGAGATYAELDLSSTSVSNLEGSITAQQGNISEVSLGGTAGYGTGKLTLPGTLTNWVSDSFEIGNLSLLPYIPHSVLSFSTNTRPVSFTVTRNFVFGQGMIVHENPPGTVRNAFPPGSRLRIGSPSSPAANVEFGAFKTGGRTTLFGKGLADVRIDATNIVIGRGSAAGHRHYITNDFREATNFIWNVSRNLEVGDKYCDMVWLYLPANGRVNCSRLSMGTNDAVATDYRTLLHLSNTVVSVSTSVTIRETGIVSNYIAGIPSGFDIGTTQLDIQDPQTGAGLGDYGRMNLRFVRNPANPYLPYWGLRIKGDGTAVISALTNTTPRRLSWDLSGLSVSYQERFGIHYDPVLDVTYVGVRPVRQGTLIMLL